MTGRPFLPALLGNNSLILLELAYGADLSDVYGTSWDWTDKTDALLHTTGTSITLGGVDNVSTAPSASWSATVNDPIGEFTQGGPHDAGIVQNLPIRQSQSLDGGLSWAIRYQGYLTQANPTADLSTKVRQAAMAAQGKLGLLDGKTKPLQSAAYRSTIAQNPIYYWPLEDGANAIEAGQAIPGHRVLSVGGGGITFGAAGAPGTGPAADMSPGGFLYANVVNAAPWGVSFNFKTTTTTQAMMGQVVTADGALFTVGIGGGSQIFVDYQLGATNTGLSQASSSYADGKWHSLLFVADQNGSHIEVSVYIDDVFILGTVDLTAGTATLTDMREVFLGRDEPGLTSQHAWFVNHLALWTSSSGVWNAAARPALARALQGWTGETADARLARLCAELGIACQIYGTSTVTMGPQGIDTTPNLLREVEAADHGRLFDGLGPGVGYVTRSERYNAAARYAFDMIPPVLDLPDFRPVFDRQGVKNLWTVNQKNGGSGTYEKATGPKGTGTIGVEPGDATINVDGHVDLRQHAAFLAGISTVPGFRYPSVPVNMRMTPDLAAAIIGAPIVIDGFQRTASSGWDDADTGQAWDVSGGSGSQYAVLNGDATQQMSSTSQPHFSTLLGVSLADADARVSFKSSAGVFASSAPMRWSIGLRVADTNNCYLFTAQLENADDSVTARIVKRVAGVETVLASATVPGMVWSSDSDHQMRAVVINNKLRLKIWWHTDEPALWTLTCTDGAITAAGSALLTSVLVAGNTNTTPVTFHFSGFTLADARPPLGYRITINNPDAKDDRQPAGPIDLCVEGWNEPTHSDDWLINFNTSPFAPNRVFVLDRDKLDDPTVGLAL